MHRFKVRRKNRHESFVIAPLEPRIMLCGLHQLGTEPSADALLGYFEGIDANNSLARPASIAKQPVADTPLFPLTAIPALDSNLGAPATVYLDFDGDVYKGTWGPTSFNLKPGATPAYDTDGDPTTFNSTELANITQIWQRVSEKFSPFNINVSTTRPAAFTDRVAIQVVIGGDGAWLGAQAGGVSYVDAFTDSTLPNTAFVFPDNLQNGEPKFVAEASAHETGHNVGLYHQSTYDASGQKTHEYNPGTSDSAPIMGDSSDSRRGLWWKGPDSNRFNEIQDDLSIITRTANGFGYRTDEAGDTIATSTTLTPNSNLLVNASGIISTNTDTDVYKVITGPGEINFSVSLPTANMLNSVLTLLDSNGNVIASSNPGNVYTSNIKTTVGGGVFYLIVSGDGTYGDLGQYTLSGSVQSPGAVVGDLVWSDTNGNGIKDAGEAGLANVAVQIFHAGDNSLAGNTTTNANGQYTISDLPAGSYYVIVTAPSGFIFSPQNVGANDTIDSDVNASGKSATFAVLVTTVITDLDAGLTIPSLGISGPTVTEGDTGTTNAIFTIFLRSANVAPVTVSYATASGTATSGVDFTAATGQVIFAPGETSKMVTVQVLNDTSIETDETFVMNLTVPSGFPDALTHATATILDNDVPSVSIGDASVLEGNSGTAQLTYTVTLSATSPKTITVDYSTADLTAITGLDYTAATGTLTFSPGQTSKTISVTTSGDTTIEGNETVAVNLSNPSHVSIADGQGVGTILSDDLTTMSIGNATVTESVAGQVDALFTLTISTPVSAPVTVTYTTADGTALADADYVTKTGTITFTPSQASTILRIPVNSDFTQEDAENFTVTLSAPAGAQIGTAVGTATIVNQDVRTATFDARHPYRYTDFIGNTVILSMKGPGDGVISFTGAEGNDAKSIVLNNTTAATQLIMRSARLQTSLVNLTVNDSILSIDAPSLNLLGNLDVTGALQKLRLNYVASGNALNIGAGNGTIKGLTATFNRVVNAKINTAIPISVLKVNNWSDADADPDITTPFIGTLSSLGDFEADVATAGNITLLKVTGALTSSIVNAAGNIVSVLANTINQSTLFAGVVDGVTTLPTDSLTQFANATSSIGRVQVRSKAANAFSSTLIAAPKIGTLLLGSINTSNAATPFGVSGNTIGSVTGKTSTQVIKLLALDDPAGLLTEGDLAISPL